MNTNNRPKQIITNAEHVFLRYVYPTTDISNKPETHSVQNINLVQFEQIKSIVQKYEKAKLVNGNFQDDQGNVPNIQLPLNIVLDPADKIVSVSKDEKNVSDIPQGFSLALLTPDQYEQYLEFRKRMKPVFYKNGQVVLE